MKRAQPQARDARRSVTGVTRSTPPSIEKCEPGHSVTRVTGGGGCKSPGRIAPRASPPAFKAAREIKTGGVESEGGGVRARLRIRSLEIEASGDAEALRPALDLVGKLVGGAR